MNDVRIDAPADDPPITPPRFRSAVSSLCVSVFRYESASRHWRPPPKNTPRASRIGLTNASESATLRSRVCSTVRFVAPFSRHSLSPDQYWSYSSSASPAVGMITIGAVGPAGEIDEPLHDRRVLHVAADDDERAFVGTVIGRRAA